jgi:hypothetical protein
MCADCRTLGIAMDAMMHLPQEQRRSSIPEAMDIKSRLSALYMHLLPNMDPCRYVRECVCHLLTA